MRSNASLIMAVQSSGSICSASDVEPTTSANSAVTGLSSPVIRAVRIFVMRGVGAAAIRRVWIVASVDEGSARRSEEHTSELQSLRHLVCRLLLEKKKNNHR